MNLYSVVDISGSSPTAALAAEVAGAVTAALVDPFSGRFTANFSVV